jgi:hypothetical protein
MSKNIKNGVNNKLITGINIVIISSVLLLIINWNFFNNSKELLDINKTCILLTTTVYINTDYKNEYNSPESRLNIYIDSINEWLQKTNLIIYVVESSNYNFPEYSNNPRVKVYSFKSSNNINCNDCSATPYEAESILKAFNYFKLYNYDNIIKITGKYFIPNMETLIENIPDNSEIFLQNSYNNDLKQQNSEIFGCKTKYLVNIMNMIIDNAKKNINFESTLNIIIDSNKYNIYRFPTIKLNKPIKRSGDNKIMYYL